MLWHSPFQTFKSIHSTSTYFVYLNGLNEGQISSTCRQQLEIWWHIHVLYLLPSLASVQVLAVSLTPYKNYIINTCVRTVSLDHVQELAISLTYLVQYHTWWISLSYLGLECLLHLNPNLKLRWVWYIHLVSLHLNQLCRSFVIRFLVCEDMQLGYMLSQVS